MNKFILASASPRRRELLENIGVKFDIVVSSADENSIDRNISADMLVKELAMLKAGETAKHITGKYYIISADTVVVFEDKILEKPKSEEEAEMMLAKLSGKKHYVYTGVCVMNTADGTAVCKSEKTIVEFKKLHADDIKAYVKTGEPMDKAGAYGIQGLGALLVKGIQGDYFNVVGLPLGLLNDILSEEFGIKLINN